MVCSAFNGDRIMVSISTISFVHPNNMHRSLLEVAYMYGHSLNDLTFPDHPLITSTIQATVQTWIQLLEQSSVLETSIQVSRWSLPTPLEIDICRWFSCPWYQQRTLCAKKKHSPTPKMAFVGNWSVTGKLCLAMHCLLQSLTSFYHQQYWGLTVC
jgi:hypothetical protein